MQVQLESSFISVFPNPTSDLIAVQLNDINQTDLLVKLYDATGKLLDQTTLFQGSTIAYFDVSKAYAGNYIIHITDGTNLVTRKIILTK
jgi:hypothetical protein